MCYTYCIIILTPTDTIYKVNAIVERVFKFSMRYKKLECHFLSDFAQYGGYIIFFEKYFLRYVMCNL